MMRRYIIRALQLLGVISCLSACQKPNERLLVGAAADGNIAAVEAFIRQGVNVDCIAVDGWTPMTVAAREGQIGVVNLLLTAGANPNIEEQGGNSPVFWAAFSGESDIVGLLVTKGASVFPNTKESGDPLITAIKNEHLPVIRLLLNAGADIERSNHRGETAQSIAARSENPAIRNYLADWDESRSPSERGAPE